MSISKLAVGGAIVATTIVGASASAFAATPSNLPHAAPGATIMSRASAAKGHGPLVKVQAGLAQALSLTPEQLKSELQIKTLDQLAAEHSMTRAQLIAQALKDEGFSSDQIQKIMQALAKAPHGKVIHK